MYDLHGLEIRTCLQWRKNVFICLGLNPKFWAMSRHEPSVGFFTCRFKKNHRVKHMRWKKVFRNQLAHIFYLSVMMEELFIYKIIALTLLISHFDICNLLVEKRGWLANRHILSLNRARYLKTTGNDGSNRDVQLNSEKLSHMTRTWVRGDSFFWLLLVLISIL